MKLNFWITCLNFLSDKIINMYVHACMYYNMSSICSAVDQTYVYAEQAHYQLSCILNESIYTISAITSSKITQKVLPTILQKRNYFFPQHFTDSIFYTHIYWWLAACFTQVWGSNPKPIFLFIWTPMANIIWEPIARQTCLSNAGIKKKTFLTD